MLWKMSLITQAKVYNPFMGLPVVFLIFSWAYPSGFLDRFCRKNGIAVVRLQPKSAYVEA